MKEYVWVLLHPMGHIHDVYVCRYGWTKKKVIESVAGTTTDHGCPAWKEMKKEGWALVRQELENGL